MPTFETIPLKEAIEATRVTTWLEEQFGEEYEYNEGEDEMGIDIYMRWDNMTETEKDEQYTGFDIETGHTGYLREAYHGSPYATRELVPEAFEDGVPDEGASISCEVLRERLPRTIELHIKRQKDVYKEDVNWESPSAESFTAFVELAERMEAAGKNPTIVASY